MAEQQVRRSGFREYGVSGLDWTSGQVLVDPRIELRGKKGIEQFDLMRAEDPTVAAILLALTLPIREAKWRVNPASDSAADREAAEFVDECMDDMSSSWDDVLTEACTMFPFGWAWMEWSLKRRKGTQPRRRTPSSKYNDGRIGFRKLALRAQSSLWEWEFDERGDVTAMLQDPGFETRYMLEGKPYLRIPMEKSILFRTTRERNNPEGFSVLRPAYRSWKFKRQIERIEAIGLQRALMGVPVIKFESGMSTIESQGQASDEARARNILAEIHDNKMLGMIEDEKMSFRFETPDMQGITGDSTNVIMRYDEAIARTTLAMYILLGTRERGSYALSRELSDLFFLAIDGYISNMAETFTRWGIPVLFRYNHFPGITELPEVTTAVNRRLDLENLGKFINDIVGAQVLTPDEELERHIRAELDWPPLPADISRPEVVKPGAEEGEEGGEGNQQPGRRAEEEQEDASFYLEFIGDPEKFVSMARSKLNAYHAATNAYRDELVFEYAQWVEDVKEKLARVPTDKSPAEIRETWEELIALGLLLLTRKAASRFPDAMRLGYGSRTLPADVKNLLEMEIVANDSWMTGNLFPAVQRQLKTEDLHQIMMLVWSGREMEAAEYIEDSLMRRRHNVAQYAGHFWRVIHIGAIEHDKDSDLPAMMYKWNLDELAEHCPTCLFFGNREYGTLDDLLNFTGGILPGQGTECDGNCRCWLSRQSPDGNWEIL
jgi:hypothetical protein